MQFPEVLENTPLNPEPISSKSNFVKVEIEKNKSTIHGDHLLTTIKMQLDNP